jgi:hypothetical protein
MTMKLKQLFVALFATSVLFVSCSKDDVFEPVQQTSIESSQGQDLRTMSTSPTVSTVGPKAYIFVEPQSRTSMIVNHLRTIPRNPQSRGTGFYSFFTGVRISDANFLDLRNYVDMPHWSDGRLPAIIQSDITQTSAGVYNMGTVKIDRNTVNNEFVWIVVLIPTNAVPDASWRQSKMSSARPTVSNTPPSLSSYRVFSTNSDLSKYVLNYTGTRIPAGQYRVYCTYAGTELRPKINRSINQDFYIRGESSTQTNPRR